MAARKDCARAREGPGVVLTSEHALRNCNDSVEFAGFYEAIDRGYYASQGLEMRLDRGGLNDDGTYIDPLQRVIEGTDDFGITTATNLIAAREKGPGKGQ